MPILRRSLPLAAGGPSGVGDILPELWKIVRPYLIIGLFSLLGAILIVAFAGDSLKDWRAAILAGYAWDSTLQKLQR